MVTEKVTGIILAGGKSIRFGKIPLKIIGVLDAKGYNAMGMDQDDILLAPYTTVQKRIFR